MDRKATERKKLNKAKATTGTHKTDYWAVGNESLITTELRAKLLIIICRAFIKGAIISSRRHFIDNNHLKIINDALTRIQYDIRSTVCICVH